MRLKRDCSWFRTVRLSRTRSRVIKQQIEKVQPSGALLQLRIVRDHRPDLIAQHRRQIRPGAFAKIQQALLQRVSSCEASARGRSAN